MYGSMYNDMFPNLSEGGVFKFFGCLIGIGIILGSVVTGAILYFRQ